MDLRIREWKSLYRLRASQRAAASRLDSIAKGPLEDTLAGAMERAGVDAREEVCIRRVRAKVRVSPSDGDIDIAAAWSIAAADAIRKAADEGDPSNVVRYASRAQALLDFAVSVARGDLGRQWAWAQLGLWRGSPSPSMVTAREELLSALRAEPAAIVPVAVTLARSGALRTLAAAWSARQWEALASAALQVIGAPEGVAARPASLFGDPDPATRDDDSRIATPRGSTSDATNASGAAVSDARGERGALDEDRAHEQGENGSHADEGARTMERSIRRVLRVRAERALAGSAIASFARDRSIVPAAVLPWLALLAAIEVEPASVRNARDGGAIVRAVLASLRAARGDVTPSATRSEPQGDLRSRGPRGASATRPATPDARSTAPRRPDAPRIADAPPKDDRTPRTASPEENEIDPRGADRAIEMRAPHAAERDARPDDRASQPRLSQEPAALERSAVADTRGVEDEDASALPFDGTALRARGFTRAGGLFFLLHIVRELDLPDAIANNEALGARPLRWSLHRLAMLLAGVAENDPAALGFAGLRPGDEPPSALEEAPSAAEIAELAAFARRIDARLAERIGDDDPATRLAKDTSTGDAATRLAKRTGTGDADAHAKSARTGDSGTPDARRSGDALGGGRREEGSAAPPEKMEVLDPRSRADLAMALALDERSPLLRGTVSRRAEIVADPGWFEVRLQLDEVTTDVRRAGLDLHPDYVPWLGVVVRFVYG